MQVVADDSSSWDKEQWGDFRAQALPLIQEEVTHVRLMPTSFASSTNTNHRFTLRTSLHLKAQTHELHYADV